MMINKTQQIEQEFTRVAPDIFGDNLIFGFIFGSFAKGYVGEGHDIDTLVHLKKINDTQQREYLDWLLDLHHRHDMQIDTVYPCEILDASQMDRIKRNASAITLSTHFNSSCVFDQIVWIQVLADKKQAVIGDVHALRECEMLFANYPEKWKAAALSENSDAAQFSEKSPLWFLKKYYPFEERNPCESPLINNKRGLHV